MSPDAPGAGAAGAGPAPNLTSTPRLRIGLVVATFTPFASGAERQAQAQGAELVRRGHEVHVLTRHGFDLPREELIDGLQVHRWIDTSSRGPLFALSFVAGVVRGLRRLRDRIDLVHTHQALWEAVGTGAARTWLGGLPTLVQPASSGPFGEAEGLKRTRGAGLLRPLILRNTAFAAISADIERQWLELGVPPARLIRMASGVDAEHFRPGPSRLEGSMPPRPRVVFTGRLHPQKNLGTLLGAWPEVARRTGARLVLVGDGPERATLIERARTLGVADSVHLVGTVDDPAEALRAADLFVLPSVAEGMSNSLLEAMATALPCLASAIGGNVDLIDDGRNGLLLPPDDPAGWSRAIIRLLDDRVEARRLGVEARSRIEREFALPVVVDRYEMLYRRLIDRSWPPGPSRP